MTISEPHEFFTIGHSNLEFNEFASVLKDQGIALVVDVRSAPYSQYANQFNRENLEHSLRTAGIGYAFAGDHLGGRPKDPSCYKTGAIPEGKANYLELVDFEEVSRRPWYQQGIARLIELASQQTTAIMCSEEDPARCHRHHLIAKTLLADGIRVRHIRTRRADGVTISDAVFEPAPIEPVQLSLLP